MTVRQYNAMIRKEGERRSEKKTARKLLERGFSIDYIADFLETTPEEVKKLLD